MSYNEQLNVYEGYVYCVKNIVTNKLYIGQTTRTPTLRWKQHIKDSKKRDCYFHRAINKYGKDNFILSVLYTSQDKDLKQVKDQLNKMEIYYVEKLNTFNPSGYNSTRGGEGNLGTPCVLYDYDGNLLCEFLSVTDAGDKLNFSVTTIWHCCNGIHSGTKFGIFRYKGDDFNKYKVDYRPDFKLPIKTYDYNGNIISVYDSLNELAIETNTTKTSVGRWLRSHKFVNFSFVVFSVYEEFDKKKITFPENRFVDMFKDGVFVKTFESASDAARYINGDASSISKCLLGKMKIHKGYTFKRHHFYIDNTLIA